MCGIIGFLRYQSKVEPEIVDQVMRFLFTHVFSVTEVRGTDASGIFQVHADGDWMMAKKGQKASEWLFLERGTATEDEVFFQDFLDTWQEHPHPVRSVIGHCRKATTGSFGGKNEDNHPFAVQLDERNAILGVHNGTLRNHEKIFSNLKEMGSPLKREGTVDSESLFHLLYHASDGGSRPWTTKDLYSVARKVQGEYALIAANSRFPEHVAVMRDGRPLEVYLLSPINVIVFTSEKKFVEEALRGYRILRRFFCPHLPELRFTDRMILERSARIFDLSKEFPSATPTWQTLDDLTEKCDLNQRAKEDPDDDWKSPTGVSYYSSYQHANHPPHRHSSRPLADTRPHSQGSPATGGVGNIRTTKADQGGSADRLLPATATAAPTTIEKERRQALVKGRYIGLAPDVTTETELSWLLGLSAVATKTLTSVELAKRVSEISFAQGYAMALVEAEKRVDKIRLQSRNHTETLEKEKIRRQKATSRIWELRLLLIATNVLTRGDEEMDDFTLRGILRGIDSNLSEERIAQVTDTYWDLVHSERAKQIYARAEEILDNIEVAEVTAE